MCFQCFLKNVYFRNVFQMFYFSKTLEKHLKNKVFLTQNIEKTLEKTLDLHVHFSTIKIYQNQYTDFNCQEQQASRSIIHDNINLFY